VVNKCFLKGGLIKLFGEDTLNFINLKFDFIIMMYEGEFRGIQVVDRHTHYEARVTVQTQGATLIIRGDIAKGFQDKYRVSIFNADKLKVRVEFTRNDQRTSRDQFKSPSHLIGSVDSLDDLELVED